MNADRQIDDYNSSMHTMLTQAEKNPGYCAIISNIEALPCTCISPTTFH